MDDLLFLHVRAVALRAKLAADEPPLGNPGAPSQSWTTDPRLGMPGIDEVPGKPQAAPPRSLLSGLQDKYRIWNHKMRGRFPGAMRRLGRVGGPVGAASLAGVGLLGAGYLGGKTLFGGSSKGAPGAAPQGVPGVPVEKLPSQALQAMQDPTQPTESAQPRFDRRSIRGRINALVKQLAASGAGRAASAFHRAWVSGGPPPMEGP